MAKLTALPGQGIIDGLKGTIDFYYWMGIPVARSWPSSPGHDRAPAVEAQWPAFTWAAKNWINLAPEIKEAYNRMASETNLTGKDLFVKGYINGEHIRIP